jgi:small subunit ribosomal protein S1
MTDITLDAHTGDMDFAALLEASFSDAPLQRGDIVEGTVLIADNYGLIVDIHQNRDGMVSRNDLEKMNASAEDFEIGQKIDVAVVHMEDEEGNLVLSVSQAAQSEDWKQAEALHEADETFGAVVMDANRGGLIIPFGSLRGFVPASHVADLPRGLSEDERTQQLRQMVNQKINIKVLEVNHRRRRLVFSQREARREKREARKEVLLDKLEEGQVVTGVVSGVRDFGAFVDIGGADGLIHISELAWHRVKHPTDIVQIGEEIEVYILRLDEEGRRIGLSLKRLQPNPWTLVDEMYHVGQLIEGKVSRIAPFGAFISMKPGIEALLHISQLADHEVSDTSQIVTEGETYLLRIISIEAERQRLGLSLKNVTDAERAEWEAKQTDASKEVPVGV